MSDVPRAVAPVIMGQDGRAARWRPVVYARTHRADQWWRVRPLDWDDRWLNDVVLDVVAGGEGLQESPRFALCGHQDRWLLGVAAMAADFDPELSVAVDSRPLYAFAGWATDAPRPAIPSLQVVVGNWRSWAGELYTQWLLADWFRHPSELRAPGQSPAVHPPWERTPTADVDDVWTRAVTFGADFVSILDRHGDALATPAEPNQESGAATSGRSVAAAFDPPPVAIPSAPSQWPHAPETHDPALEPHFQDTQWMPDKPAPSWEDRDDAGSMPRLPHPGRIARKLVDRLRGEDQHDSGTPPDIEQATPPATGAAKDLQYWRDNARTDNDRRYQPPPKSS